MIVYFFILPRFSPAHGLVENSGKHLTIRFWFITFLIPLDTKLPKLMLRCWNFKSLLGSSSCFSWESLTEKFMIQNLIYIVIKLFLPHERNMNANEMIWLIIFIFHSVVYNLCWVELESWTESTQCFLFFHHGSYYFGHNIYIKKQRTITWHLYMS